MTKTKLFTMSTVFDIFNMYNIDLVIWYKQSLLKHLSSKPYFVLCFVSCNFDNFNSTTDDPSY